MADPGLVAVLIDCDNISYKLAAPILAEAAALGVTSVRRAYGDWHSSYLNGWRELMALHAIHPIHQPAYSAGKNSTDSALIIDAMDLLFADNIGTFCIVTNDSDYTRLAMRLRESARRVFGIGSRQASDAFQRACDRYTYIDLIGLRPSGEFAIAQTAPTASAQAADVLPAVAGEETDSPKLLPLSDVLPPAIAANANDDGWAPLASVGHYVVRMDPTFDSRAYGFAKLGQLARAQPFLEVQKLLDQGGSLQVWVRVKDEETTV